MTIYEYTSELRLSGERSVALGFFDGVHIGHRLLLSRAVEYAKKHGIRSSVFTFPAESAMPKGSSDRLYETKEKLAIFRRLGIDEVILAPFPAVRDIEAKEFIGSVLADRLGCRAAICGRDFKFGQGARGGAELLEGEMARLGREGIILDFVTLYSKKVSSGAIKDYLREGDMSKANEMLGEPYYIKGEVMHGRGLGTSLGYPTVNTPLGTQGGILRRGVYFSEIEADGRRYPALTNIGSCPTFGEREVHAETFILDFDGELYGKSVKILLHSFIRDEKKFDSEGELIHRIGKDIEIAKRSFENGRKLD